jgi:hypothetical protein
MLERALAKAFTDAGISFGANEIPVPGMFMAGPSSGSTPECRIVVGPKMTDIVRKVLSDLNP